MVHQIETAINNAKQAEALKQSEEALKKSEEHFRLLVETTNVIPWEADAKTFQFTYVGPQAQGLLGYPVEKWYEQDFWPSHIHPDDCKKAIEKCLKATAKKKDFELEYRMISSDGNIVWLHDLVSVIAEDWEPKTLRGFMIDITERKQADSLLLSEKRILEMISQGKPLPEVLEHICLEVEKQTNRMLCSFCLVDDTGKSLVSCTAPNMSQDYAKDVEGLPIGLGNACCGTAAYTKKQVIVSDTSTDPLWTDFHDLALKHNLRACWSTPILSNSGELHGTFAMYYSEPREPIQWEFNIIERATNLARIAIERKKAVEALKENLDELSKKNKYEKIVSTVTQSVHRTIDLQEVLENAVEAMTENIEIVEYVSIYSVEGKEAVIQIQRGFPDGFIEKVRRIPHPKGFIWNTILEGKIRYCPDVDKDTVIGPAGRKLGTKSYVSIPLKIEGNTIGCINVHSFQKNAFKEDDINLLEVVGKQIGIAINKSKKTEELKNSKERYRTLVENAYDLIIEISIDSRFVYLSPNHKDVLGYDPNELIGRKIYENIHPDDLPAVRANFEKSAGFICSALGISFNELMGGNILKIFHH
ncbi:MAG: GAF domain-containing protein, partial [Candidatus Dadabacteria bacterium]|nr:GAF domain-containing protein [Candidatus Dadabacteria bacterium]